MATENDKKRRSPTLRFEIDGQPIPKARPRIGRNGAYTPAKTSAWERTVAWQVRALMGPCEPLSGDLEATLQFRRRGRVRADIDNLTKAAIDSMNGIAYHDDDQIIRLIASVEYGHAHPGVSITLSVISGENPHGKGHKN